MNEDFLNCLGLCRKAGMISWGHDSCADAIKKRKVKMILVASDASDRIKKEFIKSSQDEKTDIVFLSETMEEMNNHIGVFAGIFTVNDEGFYKLLKKKKYQGEATE